MGLREYTYYYAFDGNLTPLYEMIAKYNLIKDWKIRYQTAIEKHDPSMKKLWKRHNEVAPVDSYIFQNKANELER